MFDKDKLDRIEKAFIEKFSPSEDRPKLSEEQNKILKDTLGYCGAMISGSKQASRTGKRQHLAVFNANIIIGKYGKVWFGDVDITKDEAKLKKLALEFKDILYVLREHDGRFENKNSPKLDRAVYLTDGAIGSIGPECTRYYNRDAKGRILSIQEGD